jgi:serine/threonine protein kinase
MIGEIVGSYRIVSRLGRGGMGEVYVAEHPLLGSRAAVKMLLPEMCAHKDIVERFFNEAKAATRIKHPGIVQIFDFGFHSSGSAFLIMELLDGESLSARIRRKRIPPDAATVIGRQVASALAAAHAAGIIHRDLKPDNIFLVPDPDVPQGERVKILDFGIAKLVSSNKNTRTGDVFGTPVYMSPEQCQNAAAVDARSDIYSVGCILFEMITGRAPFGGEGVAQLVSAHMFEKPRAPSQVVPGLQATLDAAILRALSKSPDERQQSMAELADELDADVARRRSTPVPVAVPLPETLAPLGEPVGATGTTAMSTTLGQSLGEVARKAQRRRRPLLLVAALVATGGGVTAIILATNGRTDNETSQPPATTQHSSTPQPAVPTAPPQPDATVTIAASSPSTRQLLPERMRAILTTFLRWSASHPQSPCPTALELATFAHDPHAVDDSWGRPVVLTCTNQPAEQIVGAQSAGPDGMFDTNDDLASWDLGRDVTDIVRGPRWIGATPHPRPVSPSADRNLHKQPATAGATGTPSSAGSSAAALPPQPNSGSASTSPPSPNAGSQSVSSAPSTPISPQADGSATKKKRHLDENGMPTDR